MNQWSRKVACIFVGCLLGGAASAVIVRSYHSRPEVTLVDSVVVASVRDDIHFLESEIADGVEIHEALTIHNPSSGAKKLRLQSVSCGCLSPRLSGGRQLARGDTVELAKGAEVAVNLKPSPGIRPGVKSAGVTFEVDGDSSLKSVVSFEVHRNLQAVPSVLQVMQGKDSSDKTVINFHVHHKVRSLSDSKVMIQVPSGVSVASQSMTVLREPTGNVPGLCDMSIVLQLDLAQLSAPSPPVVVRGHSEAKLAVPLLRSGKAVWAPSLVVINAGSTGSSFTLRSKDGIPFSIVDHEDKLGVRVDYERASSRASQVVRVVVDDHNAERRVSNLQLTLDHPACGRVEVRLLIPASKDDLER